ncbi:MAG: PQQ-binding-like beta-propeller repeat protein [Segniliparus sp.]|uniref:PQQ-binding-like beta-propeller repeat protein n=1 Tax=Segniliparus sp. TaxID=2804064 RepID=UPI003F322347
MTLLFLADEIQGSRASKLDTMRRILVLLLLAGGLAACQDDSWVLRAYSAGWPGARADSHNSGRVGQTPPGKLAVLWSRPLLGQGYAQPSVSSRGFVGATALTGSGCNTFSFDVADGRKRWCLRRYLGVELSTPLADQFDTVYLGQAGSIAALAQNDSVKWSDPVLGSPVGSGFTGDGNLLVVTHLGQVEVLDAVNGRTVSAPIELVPVQNRADAAQGLADCAAHGPSCPVASPAAYDARSGRIVLSFWPPGAAAAQLVGLRYNAGDKTLWVDWRATAEHPGPLGMPVISADGSAVVATDGAGFVSARRLDNGAALWSAPTGRGGAGVLAEAPSGAVVVGAGSDPGAQAGLAAYSDKGQLWKRDDVRCLSPATFAGADDGFVLVAGAGGAGSALLRFDAGTGATRSTTELPGLPPGPSPGISVAPGGQLVFVLGGQLVALG